MNMETALRSRLIADAAVFSLVADRIFWEERPQGSGLPAITLTLIVDGRSQHLGGFQSVRDAVIQVDCWAKSFGQKKALKEAVIAALAPAHSDNGIRFQPATSIDATSLNERTETQMVFRDAVRMSLHFSDI